MEQTKIDINRIIISLSILLSAVIVSGALIYNKSSSDSPQPENSGVVTGSVVDIDLGDGPFQGDKNAPVKIIEFSDFQCPFCRVFWTNTYAQLKSEYLDTGKAVLEYRDMPLSFHPLAQKSAEGARCAEDQNKFWDFHDKLYSEQAKQGQNTIYYTEDDLRNWAKDIGLNVNDFNSCLDSNKYADAVADDLEFASELGVQGTPTFFINGRVFVGAMSFDELKKLIDSELNN